MVLQALRKLLPRRAGSAVVWAGPSRPLRSPLAVNVRTVGHLSATRSVGLRQRSGLRALCTSSGVDPEPFIQAGTLALQQGDSEEAIRQFTLAVLANPGVPTGYCFRAECRVALGNYAEAIEDFQKATELAPDLVRMQHPVSQQNIV